MNEKQKNKKMMQKVEQVLRENNRVIFVVLLAACLLPVVSPAVALFAGLAFALLAGQPFPRFAKKTSKYLLQFSVVGLGFGMNLHENEDPYNYHFTTTNFKVYNASDIQIDPFGQKHDLKIISKFSGNSMKLTNNSNGSEWAYNKASNGKDNIVLDGINTTLNGNPASANTDYGNIILDTGWNNITVTGADSVDITFSFPFIYL